MRLEKLDLLAAGSLEEGNGRFPCTQINDRRLHRNLLSGLTDVFQGGGSIRCRQRHVD